METVEIRARECQVLSFLGEAMQLMSPARVSREQITALLSQYANDSSVLGDVYAGFQG